MPTEAEKTLRTSVRRAAMDFLARREHSRAELHSKLTRKYPDNEELLPAILDRLETDNLLSDARFTEAYIRYRRQRGFGPLLIAQELRNKGVASHCIEGYLDSGAEHWHDSLEELVQRKSRGVEPRDLDLKARQKLFRFCLSRGFASEHIARALRANFGVC